MSSLLAYRIATEADCESLANLVNKSYKNEPTCQGWTNENEFVSSFRTNSKALEQLITADNSIILMFFHSTEQILVGCVHLQYKPEIESAHLGLLSVRPDLQTKGYGKMILSIGEQYAASKWNVDYIELTVIIQRKELVDFYKRRGYVETGEQLSPSYYGFVRPKRDDVLYGVMQKCLKTNKEKPLT